MRPTDDEAFAHRAFNDSLANAVRRAGEDKGECFSVYFDGDAVYVRNSAAAPPPNAKLVCIAQRWDEHVVQLRFDGARSAWVSI